MNGGRVGVKDGDTKPAQLSRLLDRYANLSSKAPHDSVQGLQRGPPFALSRRLMCTDGLRRVTTGHLGVLRRVFGMSLGPAWDF